jgi:hypothetical protein
MTGQNYKEKIELIEAVKMACDRNDLADIYIGHVFEQKNNIKLRSVCTAENCPRNLVVLIVLVLLMLLSVATAACTDDYGHDRIMKLCDDGNKQSRLLKEVKHEIAKYRNTIGFSPHSL